MAPIFIGDKMTNEQILAVFLKQHRKYASFTRQVVDDNISKTANVKSCLVTGFIVRESQEGRDFWCNLNNKWDEMVEFFELEGRIDLTNI